MINLRLRFLFLSNWVCLCGPRLAAPHLASPASPASPRASCWRGGVLLGATLAAVPTHHILLLLAGMTG
ncbi:hypothetical protein E2C01_058481 [Portunus trituberculatus]|uniref:Uncharacterized protein n=1 Tax=Portunus trituberculatus TaxID=210409 RepID=A0A5B7H4T5_PORTR|nr:hypothetical protein [Portunus trituberculatus]